MTWQLVVDTLLDERPQLLPPAPVSVRHELADRPPRMVRLCAACPRLTLSLLCERHRSCNTPRQRAAQPEGST